MPTEYLLTIEDAASALRCHRSFVYKLIAQGDLPQPIKLGRSSRFKASEFNEAVRAMHS